MPRYLVQRTFPAGLPIRSAPDPARACLDVVTRNADEGVTWLHSYVSDDARKVFCLYEAPTPEAIRTTSARNGFPVDHITQVQVLDPYFH